MSKKRATSLSTILLFVAIGTAAPPNRIPGPVDATRLRPLSGGVHHLAQPQFDRGAVDPDMPMESMLLLIKPSAAQQSELNQLLADQQNRSSPQFHKWLTPEAFGNRFGLSLSDHSKVAAWLASQGFDIKQSGRARNWILFSGTAAQVENSLHTQIHRYEVNGEKHFANSSSPSVPEALSEVIGGISGLHDFDPQPLSKTVTPDFNNGTNHFIVPADFDTIYDVNPIAAAGIDGTGVNIGIAGASQIQLSDIRTFRSRYNLPAKDPVMVLTGANPGFTSSQVEGDLDVEWSGGIAPGATVYYYYATNPQTSLTVAINANLVNIISISFGSPELSSNTLSFQPIVQQANAQGITILTGTGDNGAATAQDPGPFYVFGPVLKWPATYPEVTALGGTQFDDTANPSAYWAPANDVNSSSALSYIPEIAWPQAGGGVSVIFPKPAWQVAPGVPQDGMRDIPDMAFTASLHDAHEVISGGNTLNVGGDSCNGPVMSGVLALLNQYLIANGQISQPGLGNINPQLYQMAQSVPNAFHDITSGSNAVVCLNGTPGCLNGTFGYQAGPGYDLVTGLGSLDVNNFITQWAGTINPVTVTLSANPSSGTFNDTLQLSATVTPVSGIGTPTGQVDFSANGTLALGSATLDASSGQAIATLNVPGYQLLVAGTYNVIARYGGDTVFNVGGATSQVQIAAPAGVSSIVPVVPLSVTATTDPAGLFWQFAITLNERGGVAATLTDVNLDGQDLPVSQFFASPNIPAAGSISNRQVVLRNLAYPQMHTFIFSGVDAAGQSWSVQAGITILGPAILTQTPSVTAIPLAMSQDPTADPSCQWSQQIVINEFSGFPETIANLKLGSTSITNSIPAIFGTAQLAAYGFLQGTVCWNGKPPGETDTLTVNFGPGLAESIAVSFAGPLANPVSVQVSPTALNLSAANPQATLNIAAPDGQSWTIDMSPQNVTTGWLSLSQTSGTGSAQIVVTASASNLAPGVYFVNLIIQGPHFWPPATSVPVTFVNGDSTGVNITNLTNAASGQSVAAPGMLASLTGNGLFRGSINRVFSNTRAPAYGYSPGTYSITVNGIPAAFQSASPSLVNFQIPYETSAGTAVVGISYQGKAAAYTFQVSPSAPAIFADATGSVGTVQAGKSITLMMTGDGVTNPALADGTAGTANLVNKTAQPISVTIGGLPATVTSYGISTQSYDTTLNVAVPASVPPGSQPVAVTVGGVAVPPVTVTITP